MKTLKVKTMTVDDFIRSDEAAADFLNEMIKLDQGDGEMVRAAMGEILKCRSVSGPAKRACVSRAGRFLEFSAMSASHRPAPTAPASK